MFNNLECEHLNVGVQYENNNSNSCKFLINIARDPIIEIWQDGQINPGMDWDRTIKTQIEKADIVIMLVSQSFIASNYIHHVEMKKAFEQLQSGTTQILPILLSECDWEEWNIYGVKLEEEVRKSGRVGRYQFAPIYNVKNADAPDSRLRPINKWAHPEDAWKQIARYLRTNSLA